MWTDFKWLRTLMLGNYAEYSTTLCQRLQLQLLPHLSNLSNIVTRSLISLSQHPHINFTVPSVFKATQSLVVPITFLSLSSHSCHNMHIHYLYISFSSPEAQLRVQWDTLMQLLHIYKCIHKIFQQSQDKRARK